MSHSEMPPLDLDDLKHSAVKRMLKHALSKHGHHAKHQKEKGHEDDDAEREALSDLHEEKKGKSNHVPVKKHDLPAHLFGQDDEESPEENDGENEETETKGDKKPPFQFGKKKSGGKKPFPFAKK